MFYCVPCRNHNCLPGTDSIREARCDICGTYAACYNGPAIRQANDIIRNEQTFIDTALFGTKLIRALGQQFHAEQRFILKLDPRTSHYPDTPYGREALDLAHHVLRTRIQAWDRTIDMATSARKLPNLVDRLAKTMGDDTADQFRKKLTDPQLKEAWDTVITIAHALSVVALAKLGEHELLLDQRQREQRAQQEVKQREEAKQCR